MNLVVSGIATISTVGVIWSCLFSSCPEEDFKEQYSSNYYITHLLALLNIILLIAAKSYYLSKINIIKDRFSHIDAPESYSVLITNIPREFNDIKIAHSVKSINPNFEIIKINMVYNIRKYLGAVKKYVYLQQKIKILTHKQKDYSREFYKLKQELEKALENLYEIKKEYENPEKLKSYFTGVAFVSLATQEEANDCYQKQIGIS